MGHGQEDPYKIPDYRIYKVEDCPKLVNLRQALASQGLKDPWIRNEVWRFDPRMWDTEKVRAKTFFFRGAKVGFALLFATIIGTEIYDRVFPSEDHHHSHE